MMNELKPMYTYENTSGIRLELASRQPNFDYDAAIEILQVAIREMEKVKASLLEE